MNKQITTPDGVLSEAGPGAVTAAFVVDLAVSVTLVGYITGIPIAVGVHLPNFVSALAILFVIGYVFSGRRGWIVSLGMWTFGLRRFSYAQVEEYSGAGAVFGQKYVPNRKMRIAIVFGSLSAAYLILYLISRVM